MPSQVVTTKRGNKVDQYEMQFLSEIIMPDLTAFKNREEEIRQNREKPLMDLHLSRPSMRKTQKQASSQTFPTRKVDQEYLMYQEIFVKPKEDELDQMREEQDKMFGLDTINDAIKQKVFAEKNRQQQERIDQMAQE